MPSTPRSIISSKNAAHALGVGAVKQRRVGGHAETALHGLLNPIDCHCRSRPRGKLRSRGAPLPIQMDAESKVLARLEEVDFLLEQQGVGAEVDVLLARHQPFHDLVDLGVHKRFAARDADHAARRTHRPHGSTARASAGA